MEGENSGSEAKTGRRVQVPRTHGAESWVIRSGDSSENPGKMECITNDYWCVLRWKSTNQAEE